MKRLLSITFAVAILCLSLTACKKSEPITLTSKNFDEYFSLDLHFENFEIKGENTILGPGYIGYADAVITVTPKRKIRCEDVVLEGSFITVGSAWDGNEYAFSFETDYRGNREYIQTIKTSDEFVPYFEPEKPEILSFVDAVEIAPELKVYLTATGYSLVSDGVLLSAKGTIYVEE